MIKEIALQAGLVEAGKNTEGEDLYLGTDAQWDAYGKMLEEYQHEQEANALLDSEIAEDYK